MKNMFFALIIIVMLAALFPAMVTAHGASPSLLAGQNEFAGIVQVSNDADYLTVRYWPKAGWCLNETHLHVADSLEAIPQNRGGAIPGKFDYKNDHDCAREFTYVIPLDWPIGTKVYIAAHAVMTGPDGEETAWAVRCGDLEGAQFPGANWSAYIMYMLHLHDS